LHQTTVVLAQGAADIDGDASDLGGTDDRSVKMLSQTAENLPGGQRA
jgi:hypothetical protein